MHAIRTENLTKIFSTTTAKINLFRRGTATSEFIAVSGINLNIATGEKVAFIGPNGAGKSTTIKLLTGIMEPTSGSVNVAGLNPFAQRKQLAYSIGAVFGQRSQLWMHLPAQDSLNLLARLYNLDLDEYKQRVASLLELFEVRDLAQKPIRFMSLGERMRFEIIASLLHRPAILFLDEPTIGLDVAAKSIIRNFIAKLNQNEGTTFLLTSHDTGDIEKICDRVIIINHGKVILDTTVNHLRKRFIKEKLLNFKMSQDTFTINLDGVTQLASGPQESRIKVDTSKHEIGAIIARIFNEVDIHDITIEDPPMEDILHEIYRNGANG